MPSSHSLPGATEDIEQAKQDIDRFGYCLIANALEEAVVEAARDRLIEQAAAELEQGAAFEDGGRNSSGARLRTAAVDSASRLIPPGPEASINASGCWSTKGGFFVKFSLQPAPAPSSTISSATTTSSPATPPTLLSQAASP